MHLFKTNFEHTAIMVRLTKELNQIYLKRIKFNTGFILEQSNLVVLILVP